ncbi:excinuclease ABC subunit C [Psychrobacter sp. JCM 18901]|nr:excinuclease ABC subunit C [Psychrobacter sp. JCM 18901]
MIKKARLKHLIKRLPNLPGVYKMLGKNGDILYVGKAKSLKSRVNSYFAKTIDHPKTRALVARIHNIETIITRSETEALLLEQNLIKEHRPPYNVLLRDDKSYLYVFISADKLIHVWLTVAAKAIIKKVDSLARFPLHMRQKKRWS